MDFLIKFVRIILFLHIPLNFGIIQFVILNVIQKKTGEFFVVQI